MLCQVCKEHTATIHLTEISHGQRTEIHICEQCAQKQGIVVKNQVPLNELLSTLLSSQGQEESAAPGVAGALQDEVCPFCGMTLKKFSQKSLLGCPHDYEVFDQPLRALITRSQAGHTRHAGKVPSRAPRAMRNHMEVVRLRRRLDAAVQAEDYEVAAQIRDQLRKLQ